MTTERDDGMAVAERARERLFAVEIAAALGAPLRAEDIDERDRRAGSGQWLRAALMLLGVVVAVAVGCLQLEADREAQQPVAFDPVFPPLGEDLPYGAGQGVLIDLLGMESPPDVDAMYVRTTSPSWPKLVGRRGVRWLKVLGGIDRDTTPTPSQLRTIASMPDLQALHLWTPPKRLPDGEVLRELRAAPQLRTLGLWGDARVTLDSDLASAINELPLLRMLLLSEVPLTAEGVRGLALLPTLEQLRIERTVYDDSVFEALVALRGLRVLHLWSADAKTSQVGLLTPARMRALAAVPKLVELGLSGFDCDDAALAALPVTLQSLRLEHLRGPTAAGWRQLARLRQLRSLHWIALADDETTEALAAVVEALPLEQFFWASGPIPEALWGALAKKASMRSLAVRIPPDLARFAERLAGFQKLERLRLFCAERPASPELLQVHRLPLLRRLEIVPAPPLEKGSVDAFAERVRKLLGDRVVVSTW